MGGSILGVVAAAFAILAARRLGYERLNGCGMLWGAVGFFAASILMPGIAVTSRDLGMIQTLALMGAVAQATGAVLLFAGVAVFREIEDEP